MFNFRSKRPSRTTLCYFLGTAYASSIGGKFFFLSASTVNNSHYYFFKLQDAERLSVPEQILPSKDCTKAVSEMPRRLIFQVSCSSTFRWCCWTWFWCGRSCSGISWDCLGDESRLGARFYNVHTILIFDNRPNSKHAKESQIGREGEAIARRVIESRYREMGPMTTHEVSVAILFVLSVVLFFTRNPGFVSGWVDLFPGV